MRAELGCHLLVYDYRGFGFSDDAPIEEVRFAGAVWAFGGGGGFSDDAPIEEVV